MLRSCRGAEYAATNSSGSVGFTEGILARIAIERLSPVAPLPYAIGAHQDRPVTKCAGMRFSHVRREFPGAFVVATGHSGLIRIVRVERPSLVITQASPKELWNLVTTLRDIHDRDAERR